MVKLLTSFTLSLLVALLSVANAQAEVAGANNGPRRLDKKATPVQMAPRATTSTDPWANFKQFDWSYWQTNWGWAGHTLSYVKAWYYDEYGLNLPDGVYSWPQLSYYVNYFGTYNPNPKPSISVYGSANNEDPWITGTLASSSTSSSKAVITSSSSSSSRAASSSSSSAAPSSSSSSRAASSSSSAAAASSSALPSSTSSAAPSSSSSSSRAASSSSSSAAAASSSGAAVTWTSMGCYQDTYPHILYNYYTSKTQTVESCQALCASGGYLYAGVQYGTDCYCDNSLNFADGGGPTTASKCNMACAGNSAENCGGYYLMVIYKSNAVVASSSASSSVSSAAASSSSSSSSRAASSSSSSSAAASSSSSSSAAAPSSSSSSAAASSSSASSSRAASSSSSSAIVSSSSSSAAASSSSSSAVVSSSTLSSTSSSASASPSPSLPTVPAGWAVASTPCIADGKTGRALLGSFTIDYANTVESCLAKCDASGYPIAGLEYGNQCFCGSYLSNGASLQTTATCALPCPGNSLETCGGYYAMSLYVSTKLNGATLSSDLLGQTATLPSGWSTAAKCMPDVNGRALTDYSWSTDAMTVPLCLNKCASLGYQYGAVEYGRECYCGNNMANGADLTKTSTLCGTPCAGDPSTSCGGWNSMQVFNNPAYSYTNTVINDYVKTACLQEVSGRALRGAAYTDLTGMTVETCTAYCKTRGFVMAAVEYGSECYCGSALVGGASLLLTSGQCYMPCVGNSNENCGGPNALWLYINPNSLSSLVTLPTGWSYQGCIAEGWTARALNFTATSYIQKGTMTGEYCARQCAQLGYTMAGTEFASECYCGNSFNGGATGAILDTVTDQSGQCNYACPGNSAQMCGGASRISLYSNLATLPQLTTTGTNVVNVAA
ncbi:uncharacterized protein I303_106717 [Kwoniella dejecticola CBS 10117]|uniref:WSC domain-containing protein n=1 Tax=Kwoniella dejecticola CBS 10117 TaxID=1296121 RepID=A0A1A5ZTZ8_9TREE|nr:uncharacterized protein I303_08641 [Kwoniella dejecticola CBS 10117]OBR81255.1 hypothetical protein I303_08641 [Kwoniella dejecticola CBS 10117]